MPEQPISALAPGLQRQVEHARSASDRGNFDYAIELLRDVLRREPGCFPVRQILRVAQRKRATLNHGFKRSIHLFRRVPVLAWGWAQCVRRPSRAMDLAEGVLDWSPRHHLASRILAKAASAHGLPDTEIFALESACASRPDNHVSACRLIRACLAAGRTQEALATAEKWGRLRPTDNVIRDLLKEALVKQSLSKGGWESGSGSYRDKLRDEKTAMDLEQQSRSRTPLEAAEGVIAALLMKIEQEPESLNHHVSIVQAYQDIGDFDRALEWLDRARKVRAGVSDPGLARRAVELRLSRKRKDGGADDLALDALRISEFLDLVAAFPGEEPFQIELAECLRAAGRLDEAIAHYQRAQGASRLRVPAAHGLGVCFRAKGLYDLALEQFNVAKGASPAMDALKKQVVYALGCCLEDMGRHEEAAVEFKLIYSTDISFRDVAAKIEALYDAG